MISQFLCRFRDRGDKYNRLKKMLERPSNSEAILREGTEQDVEMADSSTNPRRTEQDIEEGESSTQSADADSTVVNENGGSSCIFRIPASLANMHHKSHEPQIVSIGPYHHKKEHLKMMEEHKPGLLKVFLENAKSGEDELKEKIKGIKGHIANSYSEKPDEVTLVDMMLLDGCFILMMLFHVSRRVELDKEQILILKPPWILPTIRSDLLLLENQVPLILLETLFQESRISSLGSGTLNELVFKFFNYSLDKPDEYWERHQELKARHLLELIRQTFIPISSTPTSQTSKPRLILSAKRLRLQGIKFKATHDSRALAEGSPKDKTILDIQLMGNELQIPQIAFDNFISSVLLNCVTFEQLSADCVNDITSYVVFMGCLIRDESDATYLVEKGIIENYFRNGDDICHFFKTIRNGVAFDIDNSYLKQVFHGINKRTSKKRNVEWARFKHLHFDSPWTCMSSAAVLAVLLLTAFQAVMAGVAYFSPRDSVQHTALAPSHITGP